MNLLTIYPIQSCNLHCYYCPMKKWTYPVNDPSNRLNNEALFKWIDEYFDPKEWLIEISGGEPGVYPEIDSLVKGLSERGFYGLIKTNGIRPIPKTDTFLRIAAWHESKDINNPPGYADEMLIIRNPNDCWKDKAKYCKEHGIPYKEVPFREFHIEAALRKRGAHMIAPERNKYIDNWCIVYSSGRIAGCVRENSCDEVSVLNMSPPVLHDVKDEGCITCSQIGGFEIHIPDEWADMIKRKCRK